MKQTQASGYIYALLAFSIFAAQDAISKHLGELYSPVFIAMIRYWWFGAFAIIWAMRSSGGLKAVASTSRPFLQIARGLLLAGQIITAILSFATVGLAHSQAIFSAAPLVVAVLSVPLLGEHVGWRRWTAICIGFIGVMIILKPEGGALESDLLIPILNVLGLAVYGVLTRLANRTDSSMTSFFYTGIVGAVAMTLIGPFFWSSPTLADWGFIAIICITGMTSHFCLIKSYETLDAVLVQPLSYLQLVFASLIGMFLFGEVIRANVVLGSVIVVCAGLFTIWREAMARRSARIRST
jgi:drug/metabolite transporter (DMT)-like permease